MALASRCRCGIRSGGQALVYARDWAKSVGGGLFGLHARARTRDLQQEELRQVLEMSRKGGNIDPKRGTSNRVFDSPTQVRRRDPAHGLHGLPVTARSKKAEAARAHGFSRRPSTASASDDIVGVCS